MASHTSMTCQSIETGVRNLLIIIMWEIRDHETRQIDFIRRPTTFAAADLGARFWEQQNELVNFCMPYLIWVRRTRRGVVIFHPQTLILITKCIHHAFGLSPSMCKINSSRWLISIDKNPLRLYMTHVPISCLSPPVAFQLFMWYPPAFPSKRDLQQDWAEWIYL